MCVCRYYLIVYILYIVQYIYMAFLEGEPKLGPPTLLEPFRSLLRPQKCTFLEAFSVFAVGQ